MARDRRHHAPDGRVHRRGDALAWMKKVGRRRQARRADLRDLHRQGGRGDPGAHRRRPRRDPGAGRRRPSPIQTVVARIETDAGAAAAAAGAQRPGPGRQRRRRLPAPAARARAAAAAAAAARRCPPPPAPVPAAPAPTAPESAEERLRRAVAPRWSARSPRSTASTSAPSRAAGIAGRVTKSDVLSYLEAGAAPPRRRRRPPRARSRPAAPAAATGAIEVPRGPAVEPWEGDRVEPWSQIRKLTADHMIMSRRVSAHVHSLLRDRLHPRRAAARAEEGEYAERGVNLTFLAFIAKAVADNLRKHPVRQRRRHGRRHRSSGATSTSASPWRSTGASSCRSSSTPTSSRSSAWRAPSTTSASARGPRS